MALTLTGVTPFNKGSKRAVTLTIAFDSSYPTGGESLSLADMGFVSSVDIVQVEPTLGYVFTYDYTNKKLIAYYGDNNNASDGALIEVPNTTDLSAVVGVKLEATGN